MTISKKHKRTFSSRFRRHTYGWRSQTPIKRIKEAVSEIKSKAFLTKPEKHGAGSTLNNFYEKNHRQYFESTIKIDPSVFLEPLIERLPKAATILDIGCGSGRDLKWLKERGYNPIGLEFSTSLARLAHKYSGCPVTVGDFRTYDFSRKQVDAVLLIGSLVHIEHKLLPEIIKHICSAVADGGTVYLSLKEGNASETGEDGRIFYLWNQRDLEAIFANLGLSVVSFSRTVSKLRVSDTWLSFILTTAY